MPKKKMKKKKKAMKNNTVTIKYEEYSSSSGKKGTRVKVSVDPIVAPVKVSGEQVKWVFDAKNTSAVCRVSFSPTSPFTGAAPSPLFGPGVSPTDPSEFESGACSTSNTGNYKYSIEIIPSSLSLGAPIIIDPEVEVWDDSPPPDSDY